MEKSSAVAQNGSVRRLDRRMVIKGLLGVGGIVGAATIFRNQGDAARRGFSGPALPPSPTPAPTATGAGNSGSDGV